MGRRAFITGIAGTELSAAEREFIVTERPWGFILFKRNVANPSQIAALNAELRTVLGDADAPILIDQEGRRDRPRRDGWPGTRWHSTGSQTYSRPWAGDRRHAFQPSCGGYAGERDG